MNSSSRKGIAGISAALVVTGLAAWAVVAQQATASASTVLGQQLSTPTFADVRASIDRLWASQPAVRTFSVDSVEYDETSRDKVLDVCRDGTVAGNEKSLQASRVSACAPMVYFLYRFGADTHSNEAMTAANQLYSYVVTRISGPASSQEMINAILENWDVTVDPSASPVVDPESPAAKRLDEVRAAISNADNVSIEVRNSGSAATAALAMVSGRSLATYRLADGSSVETLVTPDAAYVKGSRENLLQTLKISLSRSTRSWIKVPATDSAYAQLASGAVLDELAQTLLPGTSLVELTADESTARLIWDQYTGLSGGTNQHVLAVDPTSDLPRELVVTSGTATTTTSFSWSGSAVPAAPANSVPISTLRSDAK